MEESLDERAGVVYVATGDQRFVEQAGVSVRSVRRAMPRLRSVLFTNRHVVPTDFDEVVQIESTGDSYLDKPTFLARSPFERSLFLDADTYVGRNVEEVFALLERFDVAAAHAPNRSTKDVGVPPSFPELNTGVIGFRKSGAVAQLFERWRKLYLMDGADAPSRDQPSFRRAVYESGTTLAVLPPEYNCRFRMAGFYNLPIAILHGYAEEDEYARVLASLNRGVHGFASWHVYTGGVLFGGPPEGPARLLETFAESALWRRPSVFRRAVARMGREWRRLRPAG
jgi:hypothetical protein